MKQTMKILLGALLGASLGSSAALLANFTYTQKNFLAKRPALVNSAMEYPLWHEHGYALHEKHIRTHIQATGYYQRTQQAEDLGTYFGINGTNGFTVGDPTAVPFVAKDIDGRLLIHTAGGRDLAGTVSLSPYQEVFGLRLDYFQNLTTPFKKLFFRASAPIENVTTNMKLHVNGSVAQDFQAPEGPFSLEQFFKGQVNVAAAANNNNLQSPLTKAKIAGIKSETGIADLDLSLGYKFLDKEKAHVYFSFDVTVPTGNKVRGEDLFEPVYGNGRHVGLGGRIHTGFELWKSDHASLCLEGQYRYSYLLEGTESRTLSLKNMKFSQYYLVGTLGQVANTPLQPAANVLTLPLTIKPGSLLETMSTLAFCSKGFTVNVGCNTFWKDQESAWVKSFTDNAYGIAPVAFDTHQAANALGAAAGNQTLTAITASQLDINSVKTPALFTFKLFSGFGYTGAINKKYPASIGVGASYELATSNADLENYMLWAKTCFSF